MIIEGFSSVPGVTAVYLSFSTSPQ